MPFVVYLHGATGDAARALDRVRPAAEASGVAVLAPSSRDSTWDAIHGALGPDVAFLDEALAAAFDRCAFDASRLAIGGFSDGASYALTLGLANGDLFTHVVAFSPCLVSRVPLHGRPKVYLSHGRADEILPIAGCGRRLAEGLEKAGYPLTYREFDGRHEVPPPIAREGFRFLLDAAPEQVPRAVD
jgi:phospholipase/carboxylesterase